MTTKKTLLFQIANEKNDKTQNIYLTFKSNGKILNLSGKIFQLQFCTFSLYVLL